MTADHTRLWGDDPDHPILPRAHEYRIVGFCLQLEPLGASESYVDLTVQRGSERRLLRFWSPSDIEIERGGPADTGGLQVQDISGRQLAGLTVRVADFEASQGAVHFLARAVDDRTAPEIPDSAG